MSASSTAGTMMSLPLTIELLVERAATRCTEIEVVSRSPGGAIDRTTYGNVARRARQLARALVVAGVRPGDRVATLMWNHAAHLEAYFGIPLAGAVVHTLNLRPASGRDRVHRERCERRRADRRRGAAAAVR